MFEPLPTLIRDAREREQLSQLALANLAGVSRNTVVALESGEDNVSLAMLVKVANALKLKVLQIGDLDLEPALPDFKVLLLAREAIATAQKVIGQAAASHQELDRLGESVSQMLHEAFAPPRVRDVGIAKAAERLASRPADGATARALRDLADSADRVPRSAARPKARTAARKR